MGVLRSWFDITSFKMGGKRFRGSWKMSVDGTTMGNRLGSSSGSRHAPVGKADLAVRYDWKMDQRRNAAARQMVLLRSIATVHAVATVKIDQWAAV